MFLYRKNMNLSDFNMIFGKGNKNLYEFGEKNKVPPFCLPCLKISRSPRNLVWSHWRTCSSIPSHSVVTSSQGPLAPSRKSVKSEFPARNVDCQIAPHMIYHDISLNSRSVEAGFKSKCLYINICPMSLCMDRMRRRQSILKRKRKLWPKLLWTTGRDRDALDVHSWFKCKT